MDRLWYYFWDLDGEASGWRDTPVLKISAKEVTVKLNGSLVALDRAELTRCAGFTR